MLFIVAECPAHIKLLLQFVAFYRASSQRKSFTNQTPRYRLRSLSSRSEFPLYFYHFFSLEVIEFSPVIPSFDLLREIRSVFNLLLSHDLQIHHGFHEGLRSNCSRNVSFIYPYIALYLSFLNFLILLSCEC